MFKIIGAVLFIFLCSPEIFANNTMVRNAVCHFNNKSYILLTEAYVGLVAEQEYILLEKDLLNPQKMPRSLRASFTAESSDLQFPPFWRPTSIPLSSCQATPFQPNLFDEVIREFYAKVYFMVNDPENMTEDIEELVKRGEAFPFKLRVLCKSDDIIDDITFCHEITVFEKYIPVNPGED